MRAGGPDELPEHLLEVNGFRRVKGNEYYVEWRDQGRDAGAHVWIEHESTPSHPTGWLVQYHIRRRGGGYTDQGTIAEARPEDFDEALRAAVGFMREHGSGAPDLGGGVPEDFDFGGGL